MLTLREEKLRVLRAARRGRSLMPRFGNVDAIDVARTNRLIKRRDALLKKHDRRKANGRV